MTMTWSIADSADGALLPVVVAQATARSATPRRARRARGTRSAHLDELLQAAQPGRDRPAPSPVGVRDFTHVNVAARVDGETVRRDELARLEPGRAVAQPCLQVALGAVDAHARPDVRHVDV